jgi:hypothetical protein
MADRRFDAGKLGKVERTPQGGARVPAALTRTGVFTYRNADGSQRREYRPAEEVFRADSLATLRSAPVTDGAHVWVDGKNWRKVSCGHVAEGSARQDADLLVSELVIQDGDVLDAVDSGQRADISCGYTVDYDPTPGVFEGQPYDGVQRNIRYNHVTLLGAGQGRAGSRAGLRLDANDAVQDDHPAAPAGKKPGATGKDQPMIIRLDGKDFDVSKPEGALALQNAAAAKDKAYEVEKARADSLDVELKKVRTDAADSTRFDAAVTERVQLLDTAGKLLGATYSATRTDANGTVSKSNREVMIDVIRGDDKDFKDAGADGKPRSDDYIRARYDAIAEKGVRADSISNLPGFVRQVTAPITPPAPGVRQDGAPPVISAEASRAGMVQANRTAWQTKPAN